MRVVDSILKMQLLMKAIFQQDTLDSGKKTQYFEQLRPFLASRRQARISSAQLGQGEGYCGEKSKKLE